MEQPPTFWENTLLRSFAADCVLYTVIPTMLSTKVPTWDRIAKVIDLDNLQIVEAHRDNCLCCVCKKSIEGQEVVFAVRVLIAKRSAYTGASIFRSGIGSASICADCSVEKNLVFCLDSNSDMQEIVCQRLGNIFHTICDENYLTNVSAEDMIRQAIDTFNRDRVWVMKTLGKIDALCGHCKKKTPKKRCSRCHYARYCNEDCSAADWHIHKSECSILKSSSIFYTMKSAIQFK